MSESLSPSRGENNLSVRASAPLDNKRQDAKLFSIGNIFKPLRNRNFSLLFSGQLVSNIGDAVYVVALPWFMLSGGGGAQALGIVLAAFGIARVVGTLLGGVLSDKMRPRRAMLATDSVRVILTMILAFLVLRGHPALWVLCLVSALLGLFGGMFLPASMSVVPSLLGENELQAGNSLMGSSSQMASAAGLGFAGMVVALLQTSGAFGLDAITFIVSVVTLFFIRDVITRKAPSATTSEAKEETAGQSLTFGYVLSHSIILQILLLLSVCVSLGTGAMFEVALPTLLHDSLHQGASSYGFVLAGFSVGAIVGSLTAGGLGKIPYRLALSLVGFLIEALLFILLPFMGNVGVGVLFMLGAGILNGILAVTTMSIIQGALPAHLMGRVMSLFAFANFGLYPISVAVAGVIVPHYGSIPVFLVGGILLALPALVGCLQPGFWQRGDIQLLRQRS